MQLLQLTIHNFKNIPEASISFSPGINCLLGDNGMGKSNLLDAIYYLSFCRSFSGQSDSALITSDATFMMLKGEYLRRGVPEEVSAGLTRGRRKSFKRKGKEYDRISAHIGQFPLVMVSPHDSFLITGTGEERRRLVDMVISQADPVYLDALIRYSRALEQRNKLLRAHVVDPALYSAVEMSMSMASTVIHERRTAWVHRFSSIFDVYYRAISGRPDEPVSLSYVSHLNDPGATVQSILDSARRHDEAVGYTSVGVHRDDLRMSLNGMDVRRTGSQGQCKTFTIAMRLAQYDFLAETTNLRPLLLLDDIFDKLDASRVERIVDIVRSDKFGQIFITDTNRDHLDSIMSHTSDPYSLFTVREGVFTPVPHNEAR